MRAPPPDIPKNRRSRRESYFRAAQAGRPRRRVCSKNGLTASRLVDLHSLWTVSALASSVTVAIRTGIATIILAGLQPFVIGVITPVPRVLRRQPIAIDKHSA
jgi:hypothetical protein